MADYAQGDREQDTETVWGQGKRRLGAAINWAKEKAKTATDSVTRVRPSETLQKGIEKLSDLAKTTQEAGVAASNAASSLAIKVRDEYRRRFGEDDLEILENCPVVAGILEAREAFEADPEIVGLLHNVSVRPVLTAAMFGAGGVAALRFDEALSTMTRTLFDGNRFVGAWGRSAFGELLGAETSKAIDIYMDTVPGVLHPGGGWIHRVQHGHQLSDVIAIWNEHGSGGGLQALYHIYGRDFFTPSGVPILPAGSNEVHEFLTGTIGLSARQAADLVSINFVEILGGIACLTAIARVWEIVRTASDNARVSRLIERSSNASHEGDWLSASSLLDEALAIRRNDGHLYLLLANVHHQHNKRLEAHFAYQRATKYLAAEEPVASLGGAAISLRGIASVGALATSDVLVRSDEYRDAWQNHVRELASAGVGACESVAHSMQDRRLIKRYGEDSLLPERYLSAALNYYLAGQIAGASMYLADRSVKLHRYAQKYDACLAAVMERGSAEERSDALEFMRAWGKAHLPPPLPA